MIGGENGKLLELHMAESDEHEGRPLYEVIVAKCRELGISGVTVFRGLEGYGPTAEIHRHRLIGNDQPIGILIADKGKVIDKALPAIEKLMGKRLIVISDTTMKRVTTG
jgi:hypothetical protein